MVDGIHHITGLLPHNKIGINMKKLLEVDSGQWIPHSD